MLINVDGTENGYLLILILREHYFHDVQWSMWTIDWIFKGDILFYFC